MAESQRHMQIKFQRQELICFSHHPSSLIIKFLIIRFLKEKLCTKIAIGQDIRRPKINKKI